MKLNKQGKIKMTFFNKTLVDRAPKSLKVCTKPVKVEDNCYSFSTIKDAKAFNDHLLFNHN